jgi:DNA-binding transcriptional LysR family regulator
MALRIMRVWNYIEEVARAGSVRQASQKLNVTPSAVLRRIQDVEYDLGAAIFERDNSGMRLTSAGEVLIRWIRSQSADLQRVYSYIQELSGLQRGEIRIACSQALARGWLLKEILEFRKLHQNVDFHVKVANHHDALQSLIAYDTDLVLIFRPARSADLQPVMTIGQGLVAVMAADHPLAAKSTVRLRDCAAYDVALPDISFGGREVLDSYSANSSAKFRVVFEANSFEILFGFVRETQAITFQVAIGATSLTPADGLAVRPVSDADGAYGPLVLGQLTGRSLPHAAVKFAEQLSRRMDNMRSLPTLEE